MPKSPTIQPTNIGSIDDSTRSHALLILVPIARNRVG